MISSFQNLLPIVIIDKGVDVDGGRVIKIIWYNFFYP